MVYFRHGVDLDNPGPATMTLLTGIDNNEAGQASESGDSADDRSTDNATPPMHYLTPHVEISMAETAYNPGVRIIIIIIILLIVLHWLFSNFFFTLLWTQ